MKFKEYLMEYKLVVSDGKQDLETLKLKFTKKNIEKIAYNYDAKIEDIDMSTQFAKLKDNLNRLIFVHIKTGRRK